MKRKIFPKIRQISKQFSRNFHLAQNKTWYREVWSDIEKHVNLPIYTFFCRADEIKRKLNLPPPPPPPPSSSIPFPGSNFTIFLFFIRIPNFFSFCVIISRFFFLLQRLLPSKVVVLHQVVCLFLRQLPSKAGALLPHLQLPHP